jgi:hypothetical protein
MLLVIRYFSSDVQFIKTRSPEANVEKGTKEKRLARTRKSKLANF